MDIPDVTYFWKAGITSEGRGRRLFKPNDRIYITNQRLIISPRHRGKVKKGIFRSDFANPETGR